MKEKVLAINPDLSSELLDKIDVPELMKRAEQLSLRLNKELSFCLSVVARVMEAELNTVQATPDELPQIFVATPWEPGSLTHVLRPVKKSH